MHKRLISFIKQLFASFHQRTYIDYPEDFMTLAQLGQAFPSYRPTYRFKTPYINAHHQYYANCPTEGALIQTGIQGFLRTADALKLYELAYYAPGDVLEMGSAWGLSTSIICQAIADSGRKRQLVSLEIDPNFHHQTVQHLDQLQLAAYLDAVQCDAREFAAILTTQQRHFSLAFIDHCHSYDATRLACQQLQALIAPQGFVLFHDFNDEQNRLNFPAHGVYQGVTEQFVESDFTFFGLFGCTALYQKQA